jgi:hypothetical protein
VFDGRFGFTGLMVARCRASLYHRWQQRQAVSDLFSLQTRRSVPATSPLNDLAESSSSLWSKKGRGERKKRLTPSAVDLSGWPAGGRLAWPMGWQLHHVAREIVKAEAHRGLVQRENPAGVWLLPLAPASA